MKLRLALAFLVLTVGACGGPKPTMPITPPQEIGASPVVRQPLAPGTAKSAATTPAGVPAGTLYVCVVESKAERQQTAIEFAPKVAELCRKNPEMGPCQYERETCRRSGGRVFTTDGAEITRAAEAQYDKRVMRVRFRAD